MRVFTFSSNLFQEVDVALSKLNHVLSPLLTRHPKSFTVMLFALVLLILANKSLKSLQSLEPLKLWAWENHYSLINLLLKGQVQPKLKSRMKFRNPQNVSGAKHCCSTLLNNWSGWGQKREQKQSKWLHTVFLVWSESFQKPWDPRLIWQDNIYTLTSEEVRDNIFSLAATLKISALKGL